MIKGVISYLHDITGLNIPDVEEILSSLPVAVVKTGPAGASYVRRNLERLGAEVEVQ